ncbi:MAG TPA: TadE family protein [Terriglobales bacterium]|nr:TadE family protein [Terriglobales bacterium]
MQSRIQAGRQRSQRGNQLVESALVIGLVVFTLIGIVDVGQVLVMHQGLVERVRAGARYGVVTPYDATKITNVVLYNTDSPAAGSRPLLNLSPNLVSVTLNDSSTPQARIQVTITNYPFHFFTPLIMGDYTAKPIVCSMPVEDQTGNVT